MISKEDRKILNLILQMIDEGIKHHKNMKADPHNCMIGYGFGFDDGGITALLKLKEKVNELALKGAEER